MLKTPASTGLATNEKPQVNFWVNMVHHGSRDSMPAVQRFEPEAQWAMGYAGYASRFRSELGDS